jgi:hypothetical protein
MYPISTPKCTKEYLCHPFSLDFTNLKQIMHAGHVGFKYEYKFHRFQQGHIIIII